jgi:2,3-bisphosphoglycerate-independent phosphoglycerate mutase
VRVKYVVVIMDGASGWPIDSLGGRTCLAAAATPNLDAMVRTGRVGLAQTVPPGTEPSSAAACTSIVGYDPVEDRVGRGAIEAASMGIVLAPDEVALRINTVSIADGCMASYAAGHITTAESRRIVERLASELDDATFSLYPGVAYRHILVVKGHPELLGLEYTPPHDISDRAIAGHTPRGEGASLLSEYMDRARELVATDPVSRARVERGLLPVTDMWPFWPGSAPASMTTFTERFGVTAAMTSGVDLLNGLATLFGLSRLEIEGVTDGSDTDYAGQAAGALRALDDHDLVVIHVESPDEEGHAGNAAGKVAAIESIDREVISAVCGYGGDLRVLVMPDHATPIALKTHVGEPVPFLLWGSGFESNGAARFTEADAERTGVVLNPGKLVMRELLGS